MQKIGFLGPKGTFSHEAYQTYQKTNLRNDEGVEMSNMVDILHAVNDGELHKAIVPIENSLEGSVNATLDTLVFDVGLLIETEIIIKVSQNLLLKKGSREEDIKRILSHPQPIGQCREYLRKRFPKVQIEYTLSTAQAAIEVSRGDGDTACVANKMAAAEYGLEILEKDIQDGNNNYTRFVVVSHKILHRTGKDKTSIAFSTEHKPGSLYRVLDIFNLWDINLTRIESRPSKNKLGEYIFFVDITGHREDDDVQSALTMVKRKSSFYKFLGSYPIYQMEQDSKEIL